MPLPMMFRFPDDPTRVSREYLRKLDEEPFGTWLAQPKSDGWRRPGYFMNGDLFKDGCPICPPSQKKAGRHWHFFAKKSDGQEALRQPPQDLVEELSLIPFPDNTAFDMEWMGPRVVDALRGRNEFRIFDLMYLSGIWQGTIAFPERYANLKSIFADCIGKTSGVERISLVPMVDKDLGVYFDLQKKDGTSEGLVLRHRQSTLIGNVRSVQSNPLWLKVKYRDIKEPALY